MVRSLVVFVMLLFGLSGCLDQSGISDLTGDDASPSSGDSSAVTQSMRDACPLLSEEALEGWIFAIGEIRDGGLSEQDASVFWVESCQAIPPDGNFQGDVEACQACLPTIVTEVYSSG